MKLLICVDMEGISGVVDWNHVSPEHAEYARFRELMTADVNAAVRGAFGGGARDIVVADGHNRAANILIEKLDSRATLNSGTPSPFAMVQGIQQGVNAAFFVGYHARAGTQNAILDHTWSSACVRDVWLNDQLIGEIGLNAAVCGAYGVPVLLVTGDQSAAAEARALLPGVATAEVKRATGRYAAELLTPDMAHSRIEEAARTAVYQFMKETPPAPFVVDVPVRLRIAFHSSDMGDNVEKLPGLRRLDGRTVEFSSADMPTAYRTFITAVALAKH